jgi:serine phosphatase RsbU (regulator of sigma subunit)/anti-sigma regulatory factor (Ser/Thr protein kinase)
MRAHVRTPDEKGKRIYGKTVMRGPPRWERPEACPCESATQQSPVVTDSMVQSTLAEVLTILGEIVARAPAAIALVWGREHRVRLVNDRWAESFPSGRPEKDRTFAEAIPEAARVLVPLLDRVLATGEPVRGTEMPIPSEGPQSQAGYRYFTFTMSRVGGTRGNGVLIVATEATAEVARRRQLEHELAVERGVVDVLQRNLLPGRCPELPGIELAARYVPASAEAEVGGDWYDVLPLGGDRLGLAIGDVTGHGLAAAATMGQLRHALRAYAAEGHSPAQILERLDRLLASQEQMATLLYAMIEAGTGRLVMASAGHPPPLKIDAGGAAEYLPGARHAPLGAGSVIRYEETAATLEPHAALLLYTDGLVEARSLSLPVGLERLRLVAGEGPDDPEAACDHILRAMRADERGDDDTALLLCRAVPLPRDHLRLRLPATPPVLATLRATLRTWLRGVGMNEDEADELIVACSEACANVVEHAYALTRGMVEIEAARRADAITLTVQDRGHWRPPGRTLRGRGMALMRALTDEVEVHPTARGTTVHLRRRLQSMSGR